MMVDLFSLGIAFFLAAMFSILRAWSTFFYSLWPRWRMYLIKNTIMREFRLGMLVEILLMALAGYSIFWVPALFSEGFVLALVYALSGAMTQRRGRISAPIT